MVKRSKKSARKFGGPFLTAAFFCENILQDNEGILTAVRIFDAFKIQLHAQAPENVPSKELPIRVEKHLLLMFKTGDHPGKHEVTIQIVSPSGTPREVQKQELNFTKPPHGGGNLRCNVNMELTAAGLYWTDVRLDGKLITRIPLNVEITREAPSTGIQVKSTRPN